MTSLSEGLPMAVIEAKSHGIPSVMYHIPHVTLVRNEIDGFVIPRRDRDEMKEKLQVLMKDIELRKKMGRAALESSNQFDIQNIVPKWKKLFQDIVDDKIAAFEIVKEAQNSILAEVVEIIDGVGIEAYKQQENERRACLPSVNKSKVNQGQPSISIIIPVYNVEPYIRKCILSVQKQSLENFEAIIINDGTEDQSIEIIQDIIRDDQRFTIIHQANQGSGIARNTGLNHAKGEYLCFLDSDDFLDIHFLEYLHTKITEEMQISVIALLLFAIKMELFQIRIR